MKKKKIAVICSSRATYGYKRKIIGLIQKSNKLELILIVTGMHLLKEYGLTVKEIEADGYPIHARVDMMLGGDTAASWTKSIGVEIQSLSQVFSMLEPDLVMITGDRAEMFVAIANHCSNQCFWEYFLAPESGFRIFCIPPRNPKI